MAWYRIEASILLTTKCLTNMPVYEIVFEDWLDPEGAFDMSRGIKQAWRDDDDLPQTTGQWGLEAIKDAFKLTGCALQKLDYIICQMKKNKVAGELITQVRKLRRAIVRVMKMNGPHNSSRHWIWAETRTEGESPRTRFYFFTKSPKSESDLNHRRLKK